jgi:hypothetical protein
MNRSTFFLAGGLAGLGLFVAWACGGGGGGQAGTSGLTAKGKVILPTGFTLPLSRLAVSTEDGQVPVASNSAFAVAVDAQGPTLVRRKPVYY